MSIIEMKRMDATVTDSIVAKSRVGMGRGTHASYHKNPREQK
jgi:hypothetical protein